MSKIITKSDVKSIENIVNIVKTSNASEANGLIYHYKFYLQ